VQQVDVAKQHDAGPIFIH